MSKLTAVDLIYAHTKTIKLFISDITHIVIPVEWVTHIQDRAKGGSEVKVVAGKSEITFRAEDSLADIRRQIEEN